MQWLQWNRPIARTDARSVAASVVAVSVTALLLTGCATTVSAPVPSQRISAEEFRYVLPPLFGYPLTVPLQTEGELKAAASGLADSSNWAATEEAVAALLLRDPGLHPATLLLAQVEFLGADYASAVALLGPVVDELPDYVAAQLLLGRAAEKLGQLPRAYAAYRASAPRINLASARAAQLKERALEIVYNRLADSLGRGRLEDAETNLARLKEWAPDEPTTLRAERGVAVAVGDLERELAVVGSLSELDPGERSLRERLAELELEVGEPSTGLRILQELSAEYPDDLDLADRLSEAKFVWRLVMLPKEAKDLVKSEELSRGEFASVLYWLFPEVRYSRASAGLIVNDIFEQTGREQIVRVVNLGLMSVDLAMHRFYPERPVTRVEALTSFLSLMARSRPAPACLGAHDPELGASVDATCEAAARCGLLTEAAECLPGGPLSGAAAAQLSRRTLERLGVE